MNVSKPAIALSLVIAPLAVVAAAAGLFVQDEGAVWSFTTMRGETVQIYGQGLYRYDSFLIGSGFRGADLVTLVIGIPLLLVATRLYARESLRGGLLLAGTLAYFLYLYTSVVFGAAYNDLFLAYLALFSASLFAFILVFLSLDPVGLPRHISPGLPHRGIAIYLFVTGAMLLLAWLTPIVAGLVQRQPPPELGPYTTVVTFVLDLGVIAPAAWLGGVLLLKRSGMGYAIAATMLVMLLALGPALMASAAAQFLAGVPLTLPQILAFIVSFAILSLVGIGFTIVLLRNVREPAEGRGGAR